jgi:DNA-binding NtrC family response regulator
VSDSATLERRVLVLAPTAKDAQLVRTILRDAQIECEACSDLRCLCEEIEHGAAAVILPEEAIVPHRHDCLSEYLAAQPPWSDLPVLVLARQGADSSSVARAMDLLGNVTVLERPMRVSALVSAVRSALRARPTGARTSSSPSSRTSSAIRSRRSATRSTSCSSPAATIRRRAASAR